MAGPEADNVYECDSHVIRNLCQLRDGHRKTLEQLAKATDHATFVNAEIVRIQAHLQALGHVDDPDDYGKPGSTAVKSRAQAEHEDMMVRKAKRAKELAAEAEVNTPGL